MDDHPVFHQVHPARDRLYTTLANTLAWATFTAVMVALPCVVALWRWAL